MGLCKQMTGPTPFHRVFGLSWKDFFDGTDVEVHTEIDLSIKEQFLDVVLIRKGSSPLPRQLPDGFDLGFTCSVPARNCSATVGSITGRTHRKPVLYCIIY